MEAMIREVRGGHYEEVERSLTASRKRLVSRRNGRSLARHAHMWKNFPRFAKDHFTTLVNARWWQILIIVSIIYVSSWLIFAVLWLIVNRADEHCLAATNGGKFSNSFAEAFLFSIETQVTIGYGEVFITNACSGGIIVLLLQCLVGYLLDALLIGLVFTKLTRPRQRAKTILLSTKFVVHSRRDSNLQEGGIANCLQVRIADLRRSQLVEAHVRLYLYWNKTSSHGYNDKQFQQFELDVGYDTGRDRVFLLLPVEVSHLITPGSPLSGWTEDMYREEDYELVVVLEGLVEATGLTSQVVWSYLPTDMCYGHQFQPMVSRDKGEWLVDFSKLSDTELITTSL